jgi:putative membrane protein
MHGFHGGFGLGFLNLIGMVLFFGFIFMLVKGFAFRMNGRGYPRGFGPMTHKHCGHEGWKHNDAMQLARERFARGEMNQEQFETIKAGLEKDQFSEMPSRPKNWPHSDGALELARMRFAKGEISLEDYEAIKKGLQN